jgi:anti-anti-sigma factor
MPPEFTLTSDPIDDTRQVVAVAGEIDLFTAPELKAALGEALESGRIRIVVDLTETTFLDSTALGVLIGAGEASALARRRADDRQHRREHRQDLRDHRLDHIFTISPRATRPWWPSTPTKPPPDWRVDDARGLLVGSSFITAFSSGP